MVEYKVEVDLSDLFDDMTINEQKNFLVEKFSSLPINKYKEISILYQQSSIESFTHNVPHYWHFFSLDDILATDWEEVEE